MGENDERCSVLGIQTDMGTCFSSSGGVRGELYNERGYSDLFWPSWKPGARYHLLETIR